MGWLVSRTDMPGGSTIRALVTASFVTPPFLGAVAWELLAAPNSGLLNQFYRAITGAGGRRASVRHLSADRRHLRDRLLHLSVRVRAGRRTRSTPCPANWRTLPRSSAAAPGPRARRITIPMVLPALLAGALIAFLQAMTLFGSPAILALPAGFHTMTTKIWSLFQYPPKSELAAAAATAAAAAHHPAAAGAEDGARPPRLFGDRRQIRPAAARRAGRWRWTALAFCSRRAAQPGVPALLGAAQRRAGRRTLDHAGDAIDGYLAQRRVRLHRTLVDRAARCKNTVILGAATATIGTMLALVIAYVTTRRLIVGLAAARLPRHRAGGDARHRARRRPVPELYAAALRALRHAAGSC